MHTVCPRATTKNEKCRLGVNRGYEMKLYMVNRKEVRKNQQIKIEMNRKQIAKG